MSNNLRVVLYVVIGLAILALLVFTFFPNMIYAFRDSGVAGNGILSEDSSGDKCTPPPGTSEEAWREHMGHHPNIYAECL